MIYFANNFLILLEENDLYFEMGDTMIQIDSIMMFFIEFEFEPRRPPFDLPFNCHNQFLVPLERRSCSVQAILG